VDFYENVNLSRFLNTEKKSRVKKRMKFVFLNHYSLLAGLFLVVFFPEYLTTFKEIDTKVLLFIVLR